MSDRLIADREQIARFVAALFKHAPSGSYVSLRAFFDKGEARNGPAYFPFETVLVDDRQRVIDRATACATWAANERPRIVMCPPVATFSSRTSASAGSLVAGLALSVECDVDAPDAVDFLTELLGPPTLVDESGGLEADGTPKLHSHWRLHRPAMTEKDRATLKVARELACVLVDGDSTNISLVHPIRWPGSWHRKSKPRRARIVWESDVEIDLDHAYAVLYEAADQRGLVDEHCGSAGAGNPEKMASINDVAMWLRHIPNPMPDLPDTWDTWNNVAMATYGATGGSAEGLDLFLQWSAKHPDYGDRRHQAYAAARWRHFHKNPPTRLGAGRLNFLFTQYWNDSGDSAGDGDVIEGGLS
jgi:hypothetical protein